MKCSPSRRSLRAGAGALLAAAWLAAPAQAAFPGTNGPVVFERNQTPRILSGDYYDDADLMRVDPDGEHVSPLIAEREQGIAAHDPATSPDGTQVAYVRSGFDAALDSSYDRIHVAGLDGGHDHLAVPDDGAGAPAWSPDGTKLVYVQRGQYQARGFYDTLWIANADGSGTPHQIQIARWEDSADNPQWSPDGKWIAFDDGNDVYVVSMRDGEATRVTDHAGWSTYPNWAPDGSKLAYENYDDGLYAIRQVTIENGQPGADAVIHEGGYAQRPAYSPDGKQIAWAGFLEGTGRGSRAALASDHPAIIVAGADGSDPEELTVGQQPLNAPEWAPVIEAEPAATPTPTVAQPPATTPAPTGGVKGETIRRCGSRRNFVIRLRPKGVELAAARVIIRGTRLQVRKRGGRYVATIDLRTLPRQRFKVDITVWSTTGKRFHEVRRYWTCTPAR